MPETLHVVSGRAPVTPEEQRLLEGDVRAHGLDDRYWGAMNGLLTTGSRSDTPLVLRGYRGDRLAGIAHVVECRRTSQCLFRGVIGRTLDLVPTPSWCWMRGDPAVDLVNSPGFVVPGEDRETFYREAVAFLNTRYRVGSVVEERRVTPAGACYETVFMDWGRYRVAPGGTEALLSAHRHLRRKEHRFRNKGGAIDVVTGALTPGDRDAVLHCVGQSAGFGLARTPFQENYANMVRWAAESGAPGLVHVLARIDGAVAGYHTFLHSGIRLQCLSGGFDRTRHSTYHAYENILLEAMRYAEREGLETVAFGPVGNPSKAAVMPAFAPFVLRFYSKTATILRVLGVVVPRSAIRPAVFATTSGLTPHTRRPCEVPPEGAADGVVETRL
jgi:hypothetical protein